MRERKLVRSNYERPTMVKRHYEQPRDGKRGKLFSEAMGEPAFMPRGAHEVEVTPHYVGERYDNRISDLYERVEETMKEDMAAIKKLTKPTNW